MLVLQWQVITQSVIVCAAVSTEVVCIFPQAEKDSPGDRYMCISDLVAPLDSGVQDYVGMFAVSVGFGAKELCAK